MTTTPRTQTPQRRRRARRDAGYSFAELLVTVVFIGMLATIVTATVKNVTAEAAGAGCEADGRQVALAATSYLASESAQAIPASGDDVDRYELTLVEAGYLRSPSSYYELAADGTITPQEDSPC